ncbi:hypothetical protein RMATCC62417_07342 [Rhizopus microsporus]|nr:hypothetical protein RMATCC62417_07342 [Rhizopus microsporus]
MFARRMNDFVKYTDKDETKEMSYMTHEELMNRIDYMSNIIFPAIAERTKAYTDMQKGEEGILMSRNYSPEELKLISQEEIVLEDELYVIEAIIDHRGEPGNREYLVRWKNYTKEDDSWIPPENFTDPVAINQYWRRLGVKSSKEDIRKEKERYSPPKNYKKTKMKQIQEMDDADVTTNSTNILRTHKSKNPSSSNKQNKRQRQDTQISTNRSPSLRRSKRNKTHN